MSQDRVTVLSAERRENVYEGNRKVVSYKCKVILHLEGGAVDVGTLTVPEALAPEGVTPGDFHISYRAGRGYKEDKIIGVMTAFTGVQRPGAVAPKGESKA
jgi:hypothetical protein